MQGRGDLLMAKGSTIETKIRKSGEFSNNRNVLGVAINESDTEMLRKAWPVGMDLVEVPTTY